MTDRASLDELIRRRSILICCGSGGVGKTTTASALAMHAARVGRRVVVVTIDPAKRLADTLGIDELTNEPKRIDGDWTGELHAMMLDTRATFDDVVRKNAATPEQAERIFANRFYRNIAGTLSGTQEYMATEKLYELHEEADFDLVVVDTPPTRNALDFLDAPGRLTRFLDHRLFKVLVLPTKGYLKAVNVAANAFIRTLSRVVGVEVIDDAMAFFAAFEGMEAGFRSRAARVLELLEAPETAYVLVTSPQREPVEEATFFARKLRERHLDIAALVINRMHPRFGSTPAWRRREQADAAVGMPWHDLYVNLADLTSVAELEDAHLGDLVAIAGDAAVTRVPILETDVHDLTTLDAISSFLFPAPR
ncbi:MAG: ArsA family ATPase [Acidimicrobiia bacterium]